MMMFGVRKNDGIVFISSFLLLVIVTTTDAAKKGGHGSSSSNWPSSLYMNTRRFLNFGSTFSSQKKLSSCPYERVGCHPVFQVTTSYGAPYMSPEQIDELEQVQEKENIQEKKLGRQESSRLCAVYFMDPDDALEMHKQMKQMSNMGNADLRITTTTLSKALRQACNLGNGLPTGAPIDPLTGKLNGPSEGGSLRYKIVPPKRQLFYSTKCYGKERIGFGFGSSSKKDEAYDATTCLGGMSAIRAKNIAVKTDKQNREKSYTQSAVKKTISKTEILAKTSKMNPLQEANKHMEGYTGIPVFYTEELKRQQPKIKQILSGNKVELPFFFSYEDLEESWKSLRKQNKGKVRMPKKPQAVEVYNLWDVLSSMEKDDWLKKQQQQKQKISWKKDPVGNFVSIFKSSPKQEDEPGLESITFVPSSNAVHYKEYMTSRGNGKSRLRPMRGDWGPNSV